MTNTCVACSLLYQDNRCVQNILRYSVKEDKMSHKMLLLILVILLGTGIAFANNALYFDGVDDCVQILNPGVSTVFTIEFWFQPASLGQTGSYGSTLFGSSSGTNRSFWLTYYGDELRLWLFGGIGTQLVTTSGLDIGVGELHHVAVSATRNGPYVLYVDGVSVASGSTSGNSSDFNPQLTMGDLRPGRGLTYHGLIDEVRLWNDIRTQSEIQQNMNVPISPTEPGLVGYWPLDSSVGSIVYDMTTPPQNGTTQNGLTPNPQPVFVLSDVTLPVEMSSFTATGTSDLFVRLTWVTQTETDVMGYYVYRNNSDEFASATRISALIPAQNQSSTQSYTFIDEEVTQGYWYYWLQNIDYNGSDVIHGPVSYYVTTNENPNNPPAVFPLTELKAIYPNPFNPSASIIYYLAEQNNVMIDILNSKGQVVKSINLGFQGFGNHQLNWDGKNKNGDACATGFYLIRMTAGKDVFLRKAVMVK